MQTGVQAICSHLVLKSEDEVGLKPHLIVLGSSCCYGCTRNTHLSSDVVLRVNNDAFVAKKCAESDKWR